MIYITYFWCNIYQRLENICRLHMNLRQKCILEHFWSIALKSELDKIFGLFPHDTCVFFSKQIITYVIVLIICALILKILKINKARKIVYFFRKVLNYIKICIVVFANCNRNYPLKNHFQTKLARFRYQVCGFRNKWQFLVYEFMEYKRTISINII